MADFILRQREYNKVPEFLALELPGFPSSEEFQRLDAKLRNTPGLVCGAFKDYLVRLQEAEVNDKINAQDVAELDRAYDAIEKLACSADPEVENVVVVEILEHLWCSEATLARIKQRLKPKSLALYNRWVR